MFWQWDGGMYNFGFRIFDFGFEIIDKHIKIAGIKYLVSGLNLIGKLISYPV
jgi:hypothetical protein